MCSQLANQLWPTESASATDETQDADADDDEVGDADDIEKQIAKEVASMKRPRKETRFGMSPRGLICDAADIFVANCQTNTSCGKHLRAPEDVFRLIRMA